MPTKDKKPKEEKVEKVEEAEEKEEETQEEPKPGISSFSLLDTPKLSVEEVNEDEEEEKEEEKSPSEQTPADEKSEEEQAAAADETDEPANPESTPEVKPEADKGSLSSSDDVKKWLKDIRPDTTQEVEKSRGPNTKLILLILLFLLIVGAVVGGVFYYKSKVSTPQPQGETLQATPIPTAMPTPNPEATPGAELDLSKYALSILNGSGIPGEAGKVDEALKAEGFEDTKTGNADSYDFTTTTVSLKKDVPDAVFEKIKDALSDNYTVEKEGTALGESSSYDIVIFVGTKK